MELFNGVAPYRGSVLSVVVLFRTSMVMIACRSQGSKRAVLLHFDCWNYSDGRRNAFPMKPPVARRRVPSQLGNVISSVETRGL